MQKKFYSLLILAFISSAFISLNAQSKWSFGLGTNAVDFNAGEGGQFFKTDNINGFFPGPTSFYVARKLVPSFELSLSADLGNLDNTMNNIHDNFFLDLDLGLEYHFANGYFFKEDSWFAPYLFIGAGMNTISKNNYAVVNGGAGIDFWLNKSFAINVQSAYDGVSGFDNYLHHNIGIKFRINATKDSDGDGINDSEDQCPMQAGLAQYQGCPDSDGDGIIDKNDNCPNEYGLKLYNGCPDADGDGVMDKEDKCPDVKGLVALGGCPDSDNDGITDKEDNCPNVAGTLENMGCPDTDGDGVIDKDDECPNVKGVVALNGCPDADNDGVTDKDDKCPTEAGPSSNNGCPELKEEERKEVSSDLAMSAKSIQFETGKAIIKTGSYPDLDHIVDVMKRYPVTNFNIFGYTDNTGNAGSNLKLSDERSQSVRSYFISKGIASNRLNAKGFGISNPIADNSSSSGRAKNRRVEISLK